MSPPKATKTIALISGANQGIGFATAKALAITHKYHVLIGSRTLSNGEEAVSKIKAEFPDASVETVQLDITSDESIEAAAKYVKEKFGSLDVLVNNVGIFLDPPKTALSLRETCTQTFNTNITGTAVLTETFTPLLTASTQTPRIIFVSSSMGSMTISLDKTTPFYAGEYTVYDTSKAALNMLALNYGRKFFLSGRDAFVNVVCPGLVATGMTDYVAYGTSPDVGAVRIVELATLKGKDTEVTGTWTRSDAGEVVVVPW